MAGGWLSIKNHALGVEGSTDIAKTLWLGFHLKMGITCIQASLAEEIARRLTSRPVLACIQANILSKDGFQMILYGNLRGGKV